MISEYVDAEGRLSEHFHLSEFNCHDGTLVPVVAYRALAGLSRRYLEQLRERFGPVHITSGYRHAAYNAKIGGAKRSHHVYDWWPSSPAVDLTCENGTPAEWAAYLSALGMRGLGTYPVHCHADARRHKATWSG